MALLGSFPHNGPDGGNVRRAVLRTGWIASDGMGVGAITALAEQDAGPGATDPQVLGVTGRAGREAQTG